MKILSLQVAMFCVYAQCGAQLCDPLSWRKEWKEIRTAESQTVRLVAMSFDRSSD
jgi:hypothetical protein